jgi:hypothetical protein
VTTKVGPFPFGLAVNQATITIYVANNNGDGPASLSVIDGPLATALKQADAARPGQPCRGSAAHRRQPRRACAGSGRFSSEPKTITAGRRRRTG